MLDQNLDTNPMFSEDAILPEQFHAPAGRTSAEKVLWSAVFEQALADLHGGTRRNGAGSQRRARLQAEARTWIADRDGTGVGSFSWVCQMLGLDAALLRTALLVEPVRASDAA